MNYESIIGAIILLTVFWTVNRSAKFKYTQWKIVLIALLTYLMFLYLYFDFYIFHTKIGGFLKAYKDNFVQTPAYVEYIGEIRSFFPTNTASTEIIAQHEDKLVKVNELIVLSLLGVLGFLLIKIVFIVLGVIKDAIFKPKKNISTIISPFYEKEYGEIYIKNKYIIPGITAKYFGALLFFLAFISPIAYIRAYDNAFTLELFQPPLILLSAMLLMEIGFFLSGEAKEKKYGKLTVEKDDIDIISQFDLLYKKYQEVLGSKILSGHIVKRSQGRESTSSLLGNFDIDYFNEATLFLQKEGKVPDANYLEGLDTLFSWKQQGKKPNVLFSNAHDEQLEPYLKLFFEFSYYTNKKIIIPVLAQEEKVATIKWIKESISENVFDVKDCDFIDYEEQRDHILVDTLDCLMHDSSLEKYMIDFHFMVLFDLKNYIRRNHLYLNTFLQLYQAITAKSPQILGFSNIPNELEPSFNLIFVGANDDTSEIKIQKKQEKAFYLLVFDSSGERFQDLLDLDKGLYLGREVPLAYFANQVGGISSIIISSEASSLEEEFEELCKGIECSVDFKESITQINSRYYNHLDENNRLFIVDDYCNLAQTIQKWKNYALSKEVFLIIVSSPYLLRDYFTDNLEILAQDNEFYTELLPKGGLSKHEKAFMLLLCLSLNELKKDEIDLEEVSRDRIANFISDNIEDVEIHPSDIHVILRREFNGESYIENIYYSISKKNYSPQIHYYVFETTQYEELGMCLEDDIFHKYNKGMLITLASRAYRIKEFNHKKRKIIVEFIPTTKIPYYRIEKQITFDNIEENKEEVLFNIVKGNIKLYTAYRDIDFHCAMSEYTEIDSHVKTMINEKSMHTYQNKRALYLHFTRPEGFNTSFKNAFSYLLTEVFKVYFPQHYHLLGIKEDVADTDNSNTFSLWILEMSKINYHILSTIIEEKYFNKILMLMQDVILWSREANKPLAYGIEKQEDPNMDFDGLQVFLAKYLLETNEITMNRHKKKGGREGSINPLSSREVLHDCDFCGASLPFGEFERLSDGRERCSICSQSTAQRKHVSPEKMLKDILIYLEKKYAITIDPNIDIDIISSKKLHERLGKEQIISDKYDPRAVGIAVQDGERKYILIENEAPFFREMGVLIHELTHIWQYDNLDIEDIPDRLKVLEGHAMYVELEFLSNKFLEQKNYIESEKEREDIYGVGYRYMRDLLDHDTTDNPFLLLKEKKWK